MEQLAIDFEFKVEPAKGQLQDVLKMLIERSGVSERDTNYNGFRTRISELKNEHGLNVRTIKIKFVNTFGRNGSYHRHFLYSIDKPKAIILYNQINKP